eukprot:TRINITY_DN2694_c0_g2_i2.p1 TRINITY_DN2694_c0_g2~~TRINITY_DN2694_c0_g2_i2.p1  ORF type:complete len:447 (-),score=93.17 TRINITY_DN2694_c0_g2_i2:248-1588(-)
MLRSVSTSLRRTLMQNRVFSQSASVLPDQAEIVIIGGGAIGTGVAYSLAKAGKKNILLLEKESALCSVTSAQAAGLVGQVRPSVDRVKLAMWSVATFSELQKNPEINPNWRQVGSIRIAETDERVEEFKRLKASCDAAGLHVELLDYATANKMWPGMQLQPDNAKQIMWCPTDGYLQPADLVASYQHHAKKMGVKFATGALVEGIDCEPLSSGGGSRKKVVAVRTQQGKVKCQTVINAAGAHAYHIAKLVGLTLPIIPVRHEYFITEPVKSGSARVDPSQPCLRIPDSTLYGRPDVNSVLLGGWEPQAVSLLPSSYTIHQKPPPIPEDWPILSNFAELFSKFYPAIQETGVRSVFSGWPTFTPDGRFIVGPAAGIEGFVMAGGCNAHGVSGSAGIGQHVVEAMMEKTPSAYVQSLSPQRFREGFDWTEARRKAQGVYEAYYVVSKP